LLLQAKNEEFFKDVCRRETLKPVQTLPLPRHVLLCTALHGGKAFLPHQCSFSTVIAASQILVLLLSMNAPLFFFLKDC